MSYFMRHHHILKCPLQQLFCLLLPFRLFQVYWKKLSVRFVYCEFSMVFIANSLHYPGMVLKISCAFMESYFLPCCILFQLQFGFFELQVSSSGFSLITWICGAVDCSPVGVDILSHKHRVLGSVDYISIACDVDHVTDHVTGLVMLKQCTVASNLSCFCQSIS